MLRPFQTVYYHRCYSIMSPPGGVRSCKLSGRRRTDDGQFGAIDRTEEAAAAEPRASGAKNGDNE